MTQIFLNSLVAVLIASACLTTAILERFTF